MSTSWSRNHRWLSTTAGHSTSSNELLRAFGWLWKITATPLGHTSLSPRDGLEQFTIKIPYHLHPCRKFFSVPFGICKDEFWICRKEDEAAAQSKNTGFLWWKQGPLSSPHQQAVNNIPGLSHCYGQDHGANGELGCTISSASLWLLDLFL